MDGEEKIIDGFKKIFFFFCRTALHWAAKRNHSQVVNYLLENGASKEIQAHDKSTPADVCSNDSLRELLQSTTSDSKSIFLGNLKKNIFNHLDTVSSSSINHPTLPIIPNYLRNPVFPYISSQPTPPPPPINDNQTITLLCRLADHPTETDFIEFDFPKIPNAGSFNRLLSLISQELNIDHIDKLRRLPCIRIRNDRDVERLKDNHMIEVILIKTSS